MRRASAGCCSSAACACSSRTGSSTYVTSTACTAAGSAASTGAKSGMSSAASMSSSFSSRGMSRQLALAATATPRTTDRNSSSFLMAWPAQVESLHSILPEGRVGKRWLPFAGVLSGYRRPASGRRRGELPTVGQADDGGAQVEIVALAARENEHLIALRRPVQDQLHALEALVVGIDQRVVHHHRHRL